METLMLYTSRVTWYLSHPCFHRIAGWLRLEGASGGYLVQVSCSNMYTLKQLPRTVSRQLLNISKVGDSKTSLGNSSQCSVIFTVEMCFLMFQMETPVFQFVVIVMYSVHLIYCI